jgi:TRAP-type C4-dicarboxylate transport system permease small subunit
MRKMLDVIYLGSGVLAGIFLIGIGFVVLLQVGANVVDAIIKFVTGTPIGILIPSYSEFAGFFLAASSFFALAYTLRSGGHIRVNLLIRRFRDRSRLVAEVCCTILGTVISGYFTWFAVDLCLESYKYGDFSVGIVPIPLWIPQIAMAGGLFILTIAFIELFVTILRGSLPDYVIGNHKAASE